jgi:hypothetical protein
MKFLGLTVISTTLALGATVEAACSSVYGQCGGKFVHEIET